jgi:hypothetical protein
MNGDTLWTRICGYLFYEESCRFVQQTTDGGCIIAGSTAFSSGDIVVYSIKTSDLANSVVYDSVNHNPGVAGLAVGNNYEDFNVISLDATQFDTGGELC